MNNISQQKYAKDLLKKFRMNSVIPCNIHMEASKDDGSEEVDATLYQSLMESLTYLTATGQMFVVRMFSRF